MSEEEWKEFVEWWKSKWKMCSPDRQTIEQYFKWKEETNK